MNLAACPACRGRMEIVRKVIKTTVHSDASYSDTTIEKAQIRCSNDNCPVGIKTRWFGSGQGALNAWNKHIEEI